MNTNTLNSGSDELRERAQLERIAAVLTERGEDCHIEQRSEGDYNLLVLVLGPVDSFARFSISFPDDEPGGMTVYASYISDTADDANFAQRSMSENDSAEIIADYIFSFLIDCFTKDHDSICDFEPLNESNLRRYQAFLPEFFFREKNYYALGVRVQSENGSEPVGAAVFSFCGTGVVVDYVYVDEKHRKLGIGIYLANHIMLNAKAPAQN